MTKIGCAEWSNSCLLATGSISGGDETCGGLSFSQVRLSVIPTLKEGDTPRLSLRVKRHSK